METSQIVRTAGKLRQVAGIAVLALVLPGSAPAQANEFTINACQADRSEFSTRAFEDFANRGMMWRRACNPEGPGLRGLVTANVVRAGRVVQGSRSYFVMRAPEGTQFSRFTWSGQARRHDCRYALQLWADRPDGSSVAIKNVKANRGCPNQGKTQAAGWPRPETYDIAGATKVVQRVLCVGSDKTPYCSARNLNYIRTFTAAATVVDTSPPGDNDHAGQPIHAGGVGWGDAAGQLWGVGQCGGSGGAAGVAGTPRRTRSRDHATTPSGSRARTGLARSRSNTTSLARELSP